MRGRYRRIGKWTALTLCVVLSALILSHRQWALQPGDMVLTINGKPVQSFKDLVNADKLGELIFLTVRDVTGRTRTVFHPAPVYMHALFCLLAVVAVATVVLFLLDHRHRLPPGHCKNCGYDLTGNTSGRCPVCGAAVKRNSDAHS